MVDISFLQAVSGPHRLSLLVFDAAVDLLCCETSSLVEKGPEGVDHGSPVNLDSTSLVHLTAMMSGNRNSSIPFVKNAAV